MKVLYLLLFLVVPALPGNAISQDSNRSSAYSAASEAVDKDLRSALEELANLREAIAKEKIPLAQDTNQIAADLREAKRSAEIATTRKDAVEVEFEKLERDLKVWKEEKAYIESLLLDFGKSYEASLSLGQLEKEMDLLRSLELADRLEIAEKSLAKLSQESPVTSYEGEAVSSDGILIPGTFIEAGPLRWFLGEDTRRSGVVAPGKDLRPALVDGTVDPSDLKDLLDGKTASPAFDPTLGTAVALTETEDSLLEHIQKGGFWIYPILLLATVALVTAIAKWIQLGRIRTLSSSKMQEVIDLVCEGEEDKAIKHASELTHPAGRILTKGVQLDRNDRDDLEEGMYETYLELLPPLQKGLPFIAIAAATAPLLGLLGTVTGMIETFRLINIFGTGDAKNLASGISEALVTTEFGLIVAIPALIFHALLSRRIQGIKSTMEMASLAFLNGVSKKSDPVSS